MLGVGVLIPVIPLLLTDPTYPYYLGLGGNGGYVTLGLLVAIFPFMQFLATPILGQLSDRIGRKPVLTFSLLGTSLSYVVFAIGILTKNIPLLFISRALDGITGGNISVAQAAIADSTPPHLRARSFGIIGAAFGLGFVFGPFIGGKLSDPAILPWFNATTPFWFAAILSFLNMLAVAFYFKETLKEKTAGAMHFAQSFINIKKAALNRKLRPLFTTSFLFTSGFTFFTSFMGVYLISKFSFTQGGIGNYFAAVGICIALTQALITGFVGKRFPPHIILRTAFFGASATIFLIFMARTTLELYLLTIPNAMFVGLVMANITGLISRSADSSEQGQILGIGSSIQALGQAIPPVVAGYVASSLTPQAPLLVSSIIILSAALFFTLAYHPPKTSPALVPAS